MFRAHHWRGAEELLCIAIEEAEQRGHADARSEPVAFLCFACAYRGEGGYACPNSVSVRGAYCGDHSPARPSKGVRRRST